MSSSDIMADDLRTIAALRRENALMKTANVIVDKVLASIKQENAQLREEREGFAERIAIRGEVIYDIKQYLARVLGAPCPDPMEGIAALEARLRQQEAAIQQYGQHLDECITRSYPSQQDWNRVRRTEIGPKRQAVWAEIEAARPDCTCGFADTLRAIGERRPTTDNTLNSHITKE